MKKVLFIALALLVGVSFGAGKKVKSKLGDVDLTKEKDGGSVVCTAGFNDELTILKDGDTEVLVKGPCGQGWVQKSKVEYVAQAAGDKSMKLTVTSRNTCSTRWTANRWKCTTTKTSSFRSFASFVARL